MKKSHLFWACTTWTITSLFYAFQFFLRSSPNAISSQLMQEFHINAGMLGLLTSAYYIPYSLLQIPIGICLDLWGPKRILRIGTLFCILGAVLFGFSDTFLTACIGRSLIGMGAAVSFIGSIRINSLWFSSAYFAFSTGLLTAMGKLGGGALSNFFLPLWVQKVPSWHHIIWMLSAWGFVLTILVWLFVRNGPEDKFVPMVKKISIKNVWVEFVKVLKQPIVWYMGFFGYSLYVVLSVFTDTYSINFLCAKLSITQEKSGALASLAPIGSAVGASTISYMSDFLKKRLLFLRVSAFFTLVMSSLIFFGPAYFNPLMGGLLFLLGFFSGGQVLVFAVAAESLPSKISGMATGMTNAILMAGGALHNPLVGYLLDRFKSAGESASTYTLMDYQIAFVSLSVCFVVSLMISFLIKETHPKAVKYYKNIVQ
jgi:sugar phosphate permease